MLSGCDPNMAQQVPAKTNGKPSPPKSKFEMQREEMVERQLRGPGRDIRNARVLDAMRKVPRHEFVPATWHSEAYNDYPLPIGHGQTISQPYIVGLMSQLLDLKDSDTVLEIGSGSGYQAAVLAELVKHVYTIEIVQPLAKRAAATLERLGYKNVSVRAGDGYKGWPEKAPFDAVIVTCAPDHVPEPLTEQLREGGRMVIPVGGMGVQELVLLEKKKGKMTRKTVTRVRFVPMTGEARKR